jgi:hypothetical protein
VILAGAVAFAIAIFRSGGASSAGPLLAVGIAAVLLGTVEVCWREHSHGFRSHTVLLAVIPVIVFHTAVALGYAAIASPSRVVNVAVVAVDVPLFALLYRALQRRFLDARARSQR